MPTQPQLGYNQTNEASIDQVNIWMRSTPWYQNQMRAWGQDPGHPTLTKNQSAQIVKMAQANGVVVDESNMEVDDHGNFNPIGHKLRNTLLVAGVAAATIATMGMAGAFSGAAAGGVEAGATAGLGTAALPGAMATLPALSTAAATTAISAAASTMGTSAATAAAAKVAASGGAITLENILKYAVPVAGNLVGGLIQANAAGSQFDAQQKYLEEALAYEKEKDTYQRGIDAAAVARDDTRYAGYQGRIAPFIANGTSSNDRMAALLGLPARAASSSGGGSSSSPAGVPVSPEITAANLANYKALGVSATGRGTGPTDSAYYDDQIAATGGLTAANQAYWFGPGGRIALDMQKAGVKASPSAPSTTPTPASSAPVSAQPQARTAAAVQMRAPDGSVNSVPADQVDHYTQRGATPLTSTPTAPTSTATMPGSAPLVTMRGPDGSTKSVRADQVAHYQQLGATLLGAAA